PATLPHKKCGDTHEYIECRPHWSKHPVRRRQVWLCKAGIPLRYRWHREPRSDKADKKRRPDENEECDETSCCHTALEEVYPYHHNPLIPAPFICALVFGPK